MTARRAVLFAVVFAAASILAAGEVCTSTNVTVSVGSPHSAFATTPQVFFEPPPPYWVYTLDGGPFEFDVRVTLEKYEDDGGPPCVFPVGSWIWATIEITNLSDQRYQTYLGGTGRFWEVYLYDARRGTLEARFSHGQPYDDDRYCADIRAGQTLTETRIWRPDGYYAPVIPAGVYKAYGRFEPDNARPPAFTRADTTLSTGITISFVD